MRSIQLLFYCATIAGAQSNAVPQQPPAETPKPDPITEKTAAFQKLPGYFDLYWDAKTGKLWLEIARFGQEFLYVESLPAGLGSNDIGLDRGQLGADRIVRFERSGPRILLVQPNYEYRAVTPDADERRAVEESFARSVLWGFDIAAEHEDRVLVDASEFFLRDSHDVSGTLRRANQGTFRVDPRRSAFFLPRTRSFPKNTEIEVTLTLTGEGAGQFLRSVAPSPDSITVRTHHSFVELPGPGYRPRVLDPRAGFFGIRYLDFATPVTSSIRKQFIARHRLNKKDPKAPISEPEKPIVYYLDRGTPEPIRSALLDGARWWNQAFEAAGYRDAFRVEMLPEDADPMDVRYNLIQWVHRSTRGWSYGASVQDPRTGEIIKGHVTLGSLRVRQDYLIAEGLISPHETGQPANPALLEMALARLRQLSAHEVGHTLGMAHNFAASSRGRSSVMDYPHPLVKLTAEGAIDLSDAYAKGIADWDKAAITWAYQDFPPGVNEPAALKKILDDAHARGLYFLSDADARAEGGAHPAAHLWDNGTDAADELDRVLKVRAKAMSRISERSIRDDAPMASLEEVLVPVYLSHRYQAEAAAKVVGGLDYRYAVKGDGQKIAEIVTPEAQRKALNLLLKTLQPEVLTIPENVLRLIPPRAFASERTRETFPSRTGLTFDPLSAAETAAHHVLGLLMHPQRAARLVQYHARMAQAPALQEVIDKTIDATIKNPGRAALDGEVRRVVDNVVLYHLMSLASSKQAHAQVRAVAMQRLRMLRDWLMSAQSPTKDPDQAAHLAYAYGQIKKFLDDPQPPAGARPADPPPGQPIGMADCDHGQVPRPPG